MKPGLAGAAFVVLAVCTAAVPAGQETMVGRVGFLNSGAPAAQRSFLYGLAQLHDFEYEDAARAFRDPQQADPSLAIAYWGAAMTKNHPVWMEQDLAGARRILTRLGPTSAARLAKGGSARERDAQAFRAALTRAPMRASAVRGLERATKNQ